jgi:hypothetical protein
MWAKHRGMRFNRRSQVWQVQHAYRLIKESYHDAGQVSNASCSPGESPLHDQAERQCSGYSGQAAKTAIRPDLSFDARYARLARIRCWDESQVWTPRPHASSIERSRTGRRGSREPDTDGARTRVRKPRAKWVILALSCASPVRQDQARSAEVQGFESLRWLSCGPGTGVVPILNSPQILLSVRSDVHGDR